MNYIPPFETIKGLVQITAKRNQSPQVTASYQELLRLIRTLLAGIQVDEAWYLQQNDDVAQGIREGLIKSAKQHFLEHGYFEGRLPFPMPVDERFYLQANPDVAEQVRHGICPSAQAHFYESGYREGRPPRAL